MSALATASSELEVRRRALESSLGQRFWSGNAIDPLRNGDEIFPAMLAEIAAATESIEFLTYVFWQGEISTRVAGALAAAARRGVRVRVLLDGVGAYRMDVALVDEMRASGAEVRWFRSPLTWRVWRSTHRTHRKVLVCDGTVGFTGGVGIADEWTGDARDSSEWRDTHFRLRGPVVDGLRGAFVSNWIEAGEGAIDEDILGRGRDARAEGGVIALVVRSSASVGAGDVALLLQTLISIASTRIRIATAYFVPDTRTTRLLVAARARGVEIDVLVPGEHSDSRVSQLAGATHFRPLLDGGVRIWAYQPTMMHAKVITVDGLISCIGSPNFNQRSFQKDEEVAVVGLCTDLATTLDRHFDEDLERAERIDPARWRRRGPLRRLLERATHPIRSET